MKYFFKKIAYLFDFLFKMPDDKFELKIFRDHVKHFVLGGDNLYFLTKNESKLQLQFIPDKKNILFITHEYSRTGAPKVALDTIRTIKNMYENTNIVVVGSCYGELEKDFNKENIETYYYNDLPKNKQKFTAFCNKFDLIIISSFAQEFIYALGKCDNIKTPILWYAHEIFTNKIRENVLLQIGVKKFARILCGSPLTDKSIKNLHHTSKTELLIYGVEDKKIEDLTNPCCVVFSCFGSLEKRKNQKTFISAIKLMPKEIREKCKFYIIGSSIGKANSQYEDDIKNMTKNIKEIELIPNIPFEQLLEYYKKTDCIICPSTKDPMPMVTTYAFMFKKISVISNTIGQAFLCKDMENACLFDPLDAKKLSQIMVDIVENKKRYDIIRENSRKLYETYFSMDNYKKSLKENLDKYLL